MNTNTRKKILFLDAYYEPEKTAYTHLEKDLIQGLIKSGFDITIICPQPTRNVSKEQHKTFNRTETDYDGALTIKRFKCISEKKSVFLRALRYIIAAFKTYRLAKKEIGVDYIFCNSTPPIQGYVAGKVKKYLENSEKRFIPFIYHLQDIFPDSLVYAELVKKNSIFWNIGRKIENKIYSYADRIITISWDFRNNLLDKCVIKDKIFVVYNWVDLNDAYPVARNDNKLFDELNLDRNSKYIVYAGNFGKAQNIDIIVDVAKELADLDFIFVLFGSGADFDRISSLVSEYKNIKLYPLMPANRISEVYSLGDINLITCKKGFGNCSFPSKTWSILACNSYIVASYDLDSELNRCLANEYGCCVESNNTKLLANSIREKISSKINSRSYVAKVASKDISVNNIIKIIENIRL